MRRLCHIAAGLLWLLTLDASARIGTLRTLTGALNDVDVTFSPPSGLMLNLKGGGTALIPLASLVSARFESNTAHATNALHQWVLFRNGSILPAQLVRGSTTEFYLEYRALKFKPALLDVAGVLYQPGDHGQWPELQTGRTGVALKNGDFMDGTLRDLDNAHVGLNTVLFGYRQLPMDKTVAAVVLRALLPTSVRYQLRLADGSVYGSKAVPAMAAGEIFIVADPVLGEIRIPFNAVVEFKTLPAATPPANAR